MEDADNSSTARASFLHKFEPRGNCFFVTVGRGLEHEASKEIQERLGAEQIEGIAGKIFFALPQSALFNLQSLKKLKSVERVFVLILLTDPEKLGIF